MGLGVLSPQVDLKELMGGKLKFTEDADWDTATLKAPSGMFVF